MFPTNTVQVFRYQLDRVEILLGIAPMSVKCVKSGSKTVRIQTQVKPELFLDRSPILEIVWEFGLVAYVSLNLSRLLKGSPKITNT